MHLTPVVSTLTVGEEVQEEAFAIGNMAVILELLRSKMYSNPIKAIIQEISSNARDANREVGKGSEPITIVLPTNADPELQIKDSGPGITPARMSGVYLQYGNSTKRDSEEQTGRFGLGAKTPFAYSSTFGIETVTADGENGKHILRHYVATIDPSRIGKVFKVMTKDTDEPTGTTIKIPIKPKDVSEFLRWTRMVLHHWNPLPKLNVDEATIFPAHKKPDLKGEDWEMFLPEKYSNDKGITYFEDLIPYPVEAKNFEEIPSKLNALFHQVKVNIFGKGIVEVTGNRESIDYQPAVQKYLLDKLQSIYDSINADLTAKVANCKTLWEAMAITHTYKDEYNVDLLQDVKWKSLTVPHFDSVHLSAGRLFEIKSDYSNLYGVSTTFKDWGFTPRRSTVVLENSGSGRPNAAYLQQAFKHYEEHFKNLGITNWSMYVISWSRSDENAVDKEKAKLLYDYWGVPLLKDFKPPTAANTERRKYRVVKLRKFCTGQEKYTDRWEAVEDDMDLDFDGGIYVTLFERAPLETTDCNIASFVKYTGETVYGIPQRFVKDGKLGEHWIPFKNAANKAFEEAIKAHGNVVVTDDDSCFTPDNTMQYEMNKYLKDLVAKNQVNGKIAKWYKLDTSSRKDRLLKDLAAVTGRTAELTEKSIMKEAAMAVINTFPLIVAFDGIRYNTSEKIKGGGKTVFAHFFKYIKDIEAAESQEKQAQYLLSISQDWTDALKEDAERFNVEQEANKVTRRKTAPFGILKV